VVRRSFDRLYSDPPPERDWLLTAVCAARPAHSRPCGEFQLDLIRLPSPVARRRPALLGDNGVAKQCMRNWFMVASLKPSLCLNNKHCRTPNQHALSRHPVVSDWTLGEDRRRKTVTWNWETTLAISDTFKSRHPYNVTLSVCMHCQPINRKHQER